MSIAPKLVNEWNMMNLMCEIKHGMYSLVEEMPIQIGYGLRTRISSILDHHHLCFQVSSLIVELASAAAAEKGLVFDEAMEDRLCAYSRAVAHFPTAIKEVKDTIYRYF